MSHEHTICEEIEIESLKSSAQERIASYSISAIQEGKDGPASKVHVGVVFERYRWLTPPAQGPVETRESAEDTNSDVRTLWKLRVLTRSAMNETSTPVS